MITLRLNIATDAKVAIHRLRDALKGHGIEIKSRRGLGYWLEPEDKERIWEITRKVTASNDSETVLVDDDNAVAA
jgi:hypothetical protein